MWPNKIIMEFTAAQLADLKAAYASGAMTVKHGDKTTEFRSLTDMKKLIIALERDLKGVNFSKRSFLGGRAHNPALKE